jgi:hypothetical protein
LLQQIMLASCRIPTSSGGRAESVILAPSTRPLSFQIAYRG